MASEENDFPELRRGESTKEALAEARRRFEEELKSPSAERPPKRLYDIYQGNFTTETSGEPFVIVSYIWNPAALPQFPKLGDNYCVDNFDAIVEEASRERSLDGRSILEVESGIEEALRELKCPSFQCAKNEEQRVYFEEVFYYVAREAVRRKVRCIWMDSVCILQDDTSDKVDEIPRMGDFYRQAECCVVVSEMLRRKLAHIWDNIGEDAMYAPDREMFYNHDGGNRPRIENEYRKRWGLHDEVVGWIIGFHESRVWTFQETFHARELVHRGGNIRISSTAALYPGDPIKQDEVLLREYGHGTQWHHSSEQQKAKIPLTERQRYLRKVQQRMPFSILGDEAVDILLDSFEKQHRQCLKPQDHIFGVLSLYPPAVRHSLPIRYDLSKVDIQAILIYLRVCMGNLDALYFADQTWKGINNINDKPSWLPNGFAKPRVRPEPFALREDSQYEPLKPRCQLTVTLTHELNIIAHFIYINGLVQGSGEGDYEQFKNSPAEGGDIDIEKSPPDSITLVTSHRRGPVPKHLEMKFLETKLWHPTSRALVLNRWGLLTSIKKREAIMITIGWDTWCMKSDESLDELTFIPTPILWMVLSYDSGKKMWRKCGWSESDDFDKWGLGEDEMPQLGCFIIC